MTTELMAAYLAELRTLWPGSDPRVSRQRNGSASFIALPNADRPRLLVPAGNAAGSARAMLRFSAGLEVADAAKRIAVAAALRTPGRSLFADRVVLEASKGSIVDHLSGVLGTPVEVSLGIGNARANRKPVLQVFDRAGNSIAFVKIGSSPAAEPHVVGEAESLRQLGEADLPTHFELPQLLHVGRFEGHPVLMMSALETTFRQRPKRQWELPDEDMTAFARAFPGGTGELTESPLWQRLYDTRDGLASDSGRAALDHILPRLAELASGRQLELGAWHGDWTPWNMSRRRGTLQLWDFERFETGVPVGLDRYHYAVNAVLRRDGLDVSAVRRGLAMAAASPDRAEQTEHLLGATYLAAITARYLAQAETDLGDTVAERAQVILDALHQYLDIDAAGGSQ